MLKSARYVAQSLTTEVNRNFEFVLRHLLIGIGAQTCTLPCINEGEKTRSKRVRSVAEQQLAASTVRCCEGGHC